VGPGCAGIPYAGYMFFGRTYPFFTSGNRLLNSACNAIYKRFFFSDALFYALTYAFICLSATLFTLYKKGEVE
jgi:hypothetical protein